MEQTQKIFPQYMRTVALPDGAKEENADAYRICKTGKVEEDSFLTTYAEYQRQNNLDALDLSDVGSFGISCWEKKRDAKRSLTFFTKKHPIAIASKGITNVDSGVIQRTKERNGKNAKSHIDWWIYQDATPHIYFEEVSFDDE